MRARKATDTTLLLAAAASAMTYGAVFALIADLQDTYDLPTWGLGLITAATFAASVAAQIGLAHHADRGHAKLMLRAGLALDAIGTIGFALGTNLTHFVLARILLGIGGGMFIPAARRVLVVQDPGRAGEILGRLTSVEIGGFVAGPPIAAFMAEHLSLKAPFVFQAA